MDPKCIAAGGVAAARILCVAVAILVLATVPIETFQAKPSPLPPRLERYLTDTVKATPDERTRLAAGDPITKLLDADESKEVSVLGAVWINAPVSRYLDAVKDIETFERGGGFKITKRISMPPQLDDFAALRLPDDDIEDLRDCRVGDCAVKLGEEALRRFQTKVDWQAPTARAAVNALMQQLALEYVTGYLQGGNQRLAVYREGSRPTFVAQEFQAMIDQMPELTNYLPDVRRYLLGYPQVTLKNATSLLYWQETEFGLKPTIRLSHLTMSESGPDAVVTSKMLYASHYFWTGLELRVLLADPSRGPGFWFVTVNRSRSDGLSGFTGSVVRRRVRSEVEDGSLAGLRMTKERLEGL